MRVWAQTLTTYARKQHLKYYDGFAVSFMYLKLMRERKEGYMEVGESKAAIGLHNG